MGRFLTRQEGAMLHRRTRGLTFAGVLAATTIGGGLPVLPPATPAASAIDPRLAQMASPSPFRGMIYTGLSLGRKGSACDGIFEVKSPKGDTLGCTHGPDPAPPGIDVRQGRSDEQIAADLRDGRVAAADAGQTDGAAGLSVGNIGCIGDGISGGRVQAIYAVPADRTDRSATVIPTIHGTYAPAIDWQLNQSAAETGGEAHPIFVTEPTPDGTGCQLAVSVARLSAAGDDSYSDTLAQLQALGYDRPDRKYLIWMDSNLVCGWASLLPDTTPDQTNKNNGSAPFYARVDSSCWGLAEGHELMHTLGAVQQGAPHASADGHCWDEPDNMCYDDETYGPREVVTRCPGRSNWLFDCNHDDYFYAGAPPPSNWLATHWNVWTSQWLLRTALPAVATVPPPGTTSTSGTTGTGPLVPTVPDPPATGPTPRSPSGYWMLTSDGHVHAFGSAAFLGQPYPLGIGVRAVDLEPTPSGNGYWVVDDGGRVRTYGDAEGWGSVSTALFDKGEKAVSVSATPTGGGYWVFTTRGRAVPFGDAGPFGHIAWLALNRPVIGSVATPSGRGYYLFASDGGIFTFGDARFFGSTGGMRLNQPVVGMAVAPGQGGYWLVAADGGLFAFGNAAFYGSMGAVRLNRPVSAVVPGERGYLMVGQDGGAFSFGDVAFFGSLGDHPPPTPVISVALRTS